MNENTALKLDNITFVLKVAERCNIACKYCYFFDDDSYLEHPPFIEKDKVDSVVAFIRQAAMDYELDQAVVSLHGGEPLMMKKDYFSSICQQLKDALEGVCKLKIATQTNGMLIDDEWIEIFRRYDVASGISIDGPEEVHDRFRIDRRGRGTYQRSEKGIKKLRAAKTKGHEPNIGILTVIDPEADGAATYRHLVDELNMTSFNFIVPHYNYDTIPAGAVEGVRDYLISAFREWTKDNKKGNRIAIFSNQIAFFVSRRHDQKNFAEGWLNQRGVITIASNGDLGPNDYLKPLDTRYQFSGINTQTNDFHDLIAHEMWTELDEAARTVPKDCQTCRWYNACLSGIVVGDLNHRFSSAHRFKKQTVYCEALKAFFSEVESYLVTHGFPQEKIDERLKRDSSWEGPPVLDDCDILPAGLPV